MKKGFTLVEMLGVIVILSLLILITYTGAITMNRKAKEKEFEDYKKTLYMAYETHIKSNNLEIEDNMSISVTELVNEMNITVIENPNTKKKEYNAKISVHKDQAGVLVFEYIGEENEENN